MKKSTKLKDRPVLEELTSKNTGGGLEAESEFDSHVRITTPFDPSKIDVVTQQRTVDLLLTRLLHGELDLSPDFQRRANIWSDAQKSALVESILLRIPIPSLYVSEDKSGNYQVVDGLQRLCAIAHFVDVKSLNKALGTKLEPLHLKGLESLSSALDNSTYDKLPRPLKRRITECELTIHVIRAGTPPSVKFNIFSRINQGGLPLRAQEIRNAIYPGAWRKYIREMASSHIFLRATEGRIKGERLEDHELVLRFAAHFISRQERAPEQNLDDFLNDFVQNSNNFTAQDWQKIRRAFEKALCAAPRIFGRVAFRKYSTPAEPRSPINRGLFETETVVLARFSQKDLTTLATKSKTVIRLFGKEFEDNEDFVGALLYATGRGSSSNIRIAAIQNLLRGILDA